MALAIYTLVGHSTHACNGDPAFPHALKTRAVPPRPVAGLRPSGAVLAQAEEITAAEMRRDGYLDLVPLAAGCFSNVSVDGLAVYLPTALGEVAARMSSSCGGSCGGSPADLVAAARSVQEQP